MKFVDKYGLFVCPYCGAPIIKELGCFSCAVEWRGGMIVRSKEIEDKIGWHEVPIGCLVVRRSEEV